MLYENNNNNKVLCPKHLKRLAGKSGFLMEGGGRARAHIGQKCAVCNIPAMYLCACARVFTGNNSSNSINYIYVRERGETKFESHTHGLFWLPFRALTGY